MSPPIGQMMENAFIVRSSTPVDAPPVCGKTRFAVWKEDTADAGRRLLDAGLSPAILNLADELTPGGGVRKGSQAQEESLCRRSTLLVSLSQFHPEYAQADGIPFVEQGYPAEGSGFSGMWKRRITRCWKSPATSMSSPVPRSAIPG